MEVMNRLKGLDPVDRVTEALWTKIHNMVQESLIKTSQRKRNERRQSGYLRRLYK